MDDNLCISCNREVRARQHSVTCDVCDRWQHRTCGTGISQQQYRDALRSRDVLHFMCQPCEDRNFRDDGPAPMVWEPVPQPPPPPQPEAEPQQPEAEPQQPDAEPQQPEAEQQQPEAEQQLVEDPLQPEAEQFKLVVKDPFKQSGQLMSIHAHINRDGQRKSTPLVFVLMSRKTEEDYVTVLQAIKDRLEEPVVAHIVLDFEQGAWLALRRVFPLASIKGCVFHWTQAICRKIHDLGLVTSYREHQAIYSTYVS